MQSHHAIMPKVIFRPKRDKFHKMFQFVPRPAFLKRRDPAKKIHMFLITFCKRSNEILSRCDRLPHELFFSWTTLGVTLTSLLRAVSKTIITIEHPLE